MTIARLAAGLLFFLLAGAFAAKTDPGSETVWDQIMQAQSYREIRSGAQYMEDRDFENAVRVFSKAVLDKPSDPYGHMMLGSAYYWTGQVDRAEDEFREALRLDSQIAQAHMLMGIVHAWKGDGPAALDEFQKSEKLDPNRGDIQMNLGSMQESLGLIQDGLEHFRKAVALEPENPLFNFQLAAVYVRLGRDPDAVDALHAALKDYPDYEDAMLALGAVLEREGKQPEAEQMFRKAVRVKSLDAVARLRLGRAYLLAGRPDLARGVYREAFHLSPTDAGGGLALSVSFGGRPRQSPIPSAAPSQPTSPPPPQTEGAEPQTPMDVLARNLQRIPFDQEAHLDIDMAILPQPKLERARPDEGPSSLKKALERAGKPSTGAMGVKRSFTLKAGSAQARQAQIASILKDLNGVLAKAPPDVQVRMGMNLGFSHPSADAASHADAENAPKASYQPRQVGNDMGVWVAGTGWMSLVEEVLPEQGESPVHPDTPDWWVTDGLAYAALGDSRSSIVSFSRALEKDPKDELALMGRAVALVEMGREDEAIDAYKKVLKLDPKNKTAKDGLAWLMRAPASQGPSKSP